MGLIGSAETSVTDHQSTLRDIPEERRYYLHCGGSPKYRTSLALHFEVTSLRIRHFKLERVIQAETVKTLHEKKLVVLGFDTRILWVDTSFFFRNMVLPSLN